MSVSKNFDYLKAPLIEGMRYVIRDNNLSIKSPTRIFAQASLPRYYQKEELLAIYEYSLKIARARKLQVSYQQQYQKTITERWEEYEAAYLKSKEMFGELAAQARVVRKRGIHYGYNQDVEFKKLYDLNKKFSAFISEGIIETMGEINYELTCLAQKLASPSSKCSMITL